MDEIVELLQNVGTVSLYFQWMKLLHCYKMLEQFHSIFNEWNYWIATKFWNNFTLFSMNEIVELLQNFGTISLYFQWMKLLNCYKISEEYHSSLDECKLFWMNLNFIHIFLHVSWVPWNIVNSFACTSRVPLTQFTSWARSRFSSAIHHWKLLYPLFSFLPSFEATTAHVYYYYCRKIQIYGVIGSMIAIGRVGGK